MAAEGPAEGAIAAWSDFALTLRIGDPWLNRIPIGGYHAPTLVTEGIVQEGVVEKGIVEESNREGRSRDGTMAAKLLVTIETGEVREKALRRGKVYVLGRSQDAEVTILGDSNISRRHCRLEAVEGGWLLTDLGSSNGTLLNGKKAEMSLLRNGDLVELGRAQIRFVEDPEDRAEEAVSAIDTEEIGGTAGREIVEPGLPPPLDLGEDLRGPPPEGASPPAADESPIVLAPPSSEETPHADTPHAETPHLAEPPAEGLGAEEMVTAPPPPAGEDVGPSPALPPPPAPARRLPARRAISGALFAAALLGALLPFSNVSIAPTGGEAISLTVIRLALGTMVGPAAGPGAESPEPFLRVFFEDIGGRSGIAGRSIRSSPEVWAGIVLLCIAGGLAAGLVRRETMALAPAAAGLLGFISLVLLRSRISYALAAGTLGIQSARPGPGYWMPAILLLGAAGWNGIAWGLAVAARRRRGSSAGTSIENPPAVSVLSASAARGLTLAGAAIQVVDILAIPFWRGIGHLPSANLIQIEGYGNGFLALAVGVGILAFLEKPIIRLAGQSACLAIPAFFWAAWLLAGPGDPGADFAAGFWLLPLGLAASGIGAAAQFMNRSSRRG
jgi:hypothetical protein